MRVGKHLSVVVLALVMLLGNAGAAEARWFETQPHWWTSGRTCIASRGPAARRWQALPPRSCRASNVRTIAFEAASVSVVEKQERAAPKPSFDGLVLAPAQAEEENSKSRW